jgi:hypothetical protein
MNQTEQSIYNFKKGDLITRLKPMVDGDGFRDFSLVGTEVTFIGIANACIYLSKRADFFSQMLLGLAVSQVKIPLELGQDGWAFYVKPDFLEDQDPTEFTDQGMVEAEIQKAIEKEDYMRAEYLKQKLEELLKKNKDGK